jgi:SPX domain protein involved in polyphosphate accumulation
MDESVDFPPGRFERKYLVTDEIAVAVRDAIRPYVDVDVHMPPGSVRGYVVHSLYLDNASLDLYRQTRECQSERFKLRIRFYDHQSEGKAYVEIKEKSAGQVYKRRYGAEKALIESMLGDPRSELVSHALSNGARNSALEEFCRVREEIGADPKLFVTYDREAYNSTSGPTVRVTFDRRIRTNAFGHESGLNVPRFGTNVGGLNVLLEFKYAGDPPQWVEDVLQTFLLKRASFSKFAECIDALGITGRAPREIKVTRKK